MACRSIQVHVPPRRASACRSAPTLNIFGNTPGCSKSKGTSLIGYVTLGTRDLERAAAFYEAVLAEIDAVRCHEQVHFVAWRLVTGGPQLCLITPYDGEPATVGNGAMVGIYAGTREKVDAAHAKALQLGGKDEGAAGPRNYAPGFYAGYFRDLDGNKLNFFCTAQTR
jgi:predicted lactoylglutathione lyase